ncbi:hypothetical protein [Haloterrigena salifodinae]|uniref:hypothetical protein n=1 Tax=Haloterrigena salifodinae TaxID=2675099 RepID=UPI000F88D4AE|nr:hypothetical protein [Haloterrigena salifodinae]
MNKLRLQSTSVTPAVVLAALVCCLLIGAVVGIPWLFADPYETSDYHAITHESTGVYDVSTDDPTPIDELSPAAQAVVEHGITDYRNSDRDSVSYSVKYCREEMPVCDETERPDDFTYASTNPGDFYDVIETDDGIYILKTTDGTIGGDPGPFSGLEEKHIIFATVIIPVVGVLAFMAVTSHFSITPAGGGTPNRNVILGLALYGILFTGLGIVDPLLEMYYGFSFSEDFLGIGIVSMWVILFATVIHPFFDW